MNVIGIDPGMIRLGLGALEYKNGDISLITYGLISNPREKYTTYNEFLNGGIYQIANDLPRLIDLVQPNIIVAELLPPGRLGSNSDSVMAALTVCKVIAYQFGIAWQDIAASTVKKAVTGVANASKAKIRNVVLDEFAVVKARHAELKMEEKNAGEKAIGLPQDVFDGLAIAWAYLLNNEMKHESKKEDSA